MFQYNVLFLTSSNKNKWVIS